MDVLDLRVNDSADDGIMYHFVVSRLRLLPSPILVIYFLFAVFRKSGEKPRRVAAGDLPCTCG